MIVSRGAFTIVIVIVIAGLAADAAVPVPGLSALAATYVRIMTMTGPPIARAGDPFGRLAAQRAPARKQARVPRALRSVKALGDVEDVEPAAP